MWPVGAKTPRILMMFCDIFLCLQRNLGSVIQYWVTCHILYMLYIQKPLLMQIHWMSVKNDKTIIFYAPKMMLKLFVWWHGTISSLSWSIMGSIHKCKDIKNCLNNRKKVLWFSPWTMLFRLSFKVPFSLRCNLCLEWYYWTFWYTSSPLALSGRYI